MRRIVRGVPALARRGSSLDARVDAGAAVSQCAADCQPEYDESRATIVFLLNPSGGYLLVPAADAASLKYATLLLGV